MTINLIICTLLLFPLLQARGILSNPPDEQLSDEEKALRELSNAWGIWPDRPVMERYCSTRDLVQLKCDENFTTVTEIRLRARTFDHPSNPTIPGSIKAFKNLKVLDLSITGIGGSVPKEIGELSQLLYLLLEQNHFVSIPPEIGNLSNLVNLGANNNYIPSIPKELAKLKNLQHLNLDVNQITGTIPQEFEDMPELRTLKLRYNQLVGSVPNLPHLEEIDLSHNNLQGTLPKWSQHNSKLRRLNLSENQLSGNLGKDFLQQLQLSYLDLSKNRFSGVLPAEFDNQILSKLSFSHIDLSHNQFSGTFNFTVWARTVRYLDISNNSFACDASQFGLFTQLTHLNCSNNLFFGTDPFKSISDAPVLKIMDLSQNNLSQPLNILNWIQRAKIIDLIDVSGNPQLPLFSSSINLQKNPNTLTLINDELKFECARLSIPYIKQFIYDDFLFNWTQCNCYPGYFGTPPACYLCNFTQQGITCEGSRNLSIPANWYPIIVGRQVQFEGCVTIHPSESSCNASAYLQADKNGIYLVESVCQTGSTGRKCSNCICNSTECYFRRGPKCRLCKDLMPKSVFVTLIAAATIVVLVFLVFFFYQSLDLRRRQLVPWSELRLWRRVFYRAKSAARFGMTKILISFVQSVIVLSSWDVYLELTWLKIMNAMNLGRWGIQCYIRSLANLSTEFYVHMAIPLISSAILALTVGLASLIWRLKHPKKRSNKTDYEIISSESPKGYTTYSAWSLLVSSVIAVLTFLYFGLSFSVVANFICEKQPLSKEKYLLAYPWQLCSEIRHLQRMSFVPLVFYVVGIPFVYGIILWCIRKHLTNTRVLDYFYPLYRAYKLQCAWYGLIVITRMFLLAVVLRVTSEQDPSHAFFVVMILSVSLVIQFVFKPWKGRYENIAERISLLLCIITFMLRLAPNEENTGDQVLVFKWFPLQILMIVLDCLYMIVLVVVIIWRSSKEACEYHALYAAISKVDDADQQLLKTEKFSKFGSSKLDSEYDQFLTSEEDAKSFGFLSESENETEDDEM